MAVEMRGDGLFGRRDLSGEMGEPAPDLLCDEGMAGATGGSSVLLLRLHGFELFTALHEVAQRLARRVGRGPSLCAETGEHRGVDTVGLRRVERAGEESGMARIEALARSAGGVEGAAKRPVATRGRLVDDEIVRTEPGGPPGDGAGLVGDARHAAA